MRLTHLSFAILLSLSHIQVNAEEYTDLGSEEFFDDFYGSEEMVEIATGVKTQIFKAPAVANVFSAEQIKNMGATDIDDVLETVPGLHISRIDNSYLPVYTFRGIHSENNSQVLMLINSIPITNAFTGNRNQIWGGMPIEAISRIEVMRGPGSALFGADAVSGIINIITKSADDIKQNEVAVRLGENDTQDAWFTLGGESGELKYSAIVEYHHTDGADETIEADLQTFNDTVMGTNVSNAPGAVSLTVENLDIRTELNYLGFTLRSGLQERDDIGMGAGLIGSLDPEARAYSKRWNIDANYHTQLSNNFEFDIQAAYFDTSQEIKNQYTIFPAGFAGSFPDGSLLYPDGFIGNPEVWEKHTRFNATGLYTGLDSHTFRMGIGYHNADLHRVEESKNFALDASGNPIPPRSPLVDVTDSPYVFIPEIDRDNSYAFIQDVWAVANDWELTAGIRYDDYSDFGSTTNPRLALVWSTTLNLSTKLLYGQAFRAPSFTDTSADNNPNALGNANIQPEEMENFELAFDYHPGDGFGLIWSLYSYNWEDIIQLAPSEIGIQAQNLGKQTAYGSELEVNWQATDNLTFRANASWMNTENDLTDHDVAYVPHSQYYLQLDWKVTDELKLNVKNNYVLDRKRNEEDLRSQIDDYIITDLTLRWLPKGLPIELSLLGKNIFNNDAREPSFNEGPVAPIANDLPLPGRSIYGELRYKF